MHPALFPFLLSNWEDAPIQAAAAEDEDVSVGTTTPADVAAATVFVTTLMERRGKRTLGYNPHRFVELHGGEMIEPTAFEPDPITHRNNYYYNSVTNVLYKRVYDRYEPKRGIIVAHWAAISR